MRMHVQGHRPECSPGKVQIASRFSEDEFAWLKEQADDREWSVNHMICACVRLAMKQVAEGKVR